MLTKDKLFVDKRQTQRNEETRRLEGNGGLTREEKKKEKERERERGCVCVREREHEGIR